MSKKYTFDDFTIGEEVTVSYQGTEQVVTFSGTVDRFDDGGGMVPSVYLKTDDARFFGEAPIPLVNIIEVKRE